MYKYLYRNVVSSFLNRIILGSEAEREVEKFLKAFLPGTPFAGKVKAIGGYVRDEYLSLIKNDPSIEAKDLDLLVEMENGAEKATKYIYNTFNTRWNKVKKFFTGVNRNPISTPRQLGKGYPIWQITFKDDITYKGKTYKTKGAIIEFADTMKESYPDPESRQRKTEPAGLKEDIERRDFTVNMLLKDMTTGEIEDLTGTSKEDISKGILKGHPDVSLDTMFNNDPLRMLRLIRFKTKYGWNIPLYVIRAVKRNSERINIVSSERITEELKKIMTYGKLSEAIKFMSITGLLQHVLPEVEALKGVKQSPDHHAEGDVYKHTLLVLKNAPPGIENQMAALLHDIGKPGEARDMGEKITFYGHEESGAQIAEAIMKRLKFDNITTDRVKGMVRNHMRPHNIGSSPTSKALRKFVREVGEELIDSVLDLARADELGSLPSFEDIPDLRNKIDEIRKEKVKEKKKAILSGKEIMDLLNIKEGPEVGEAISVLNDIIDEKGINLTKEEAKEELKKRFKKD